MPVGDGPALRWISLSGTASRRTLLAWTALLVAAELLGRDILRQVPPPGLGMRLLACVPTAILLPGTLAALVRRLHATGRSGWWGLLVCVPFIGLVAFLVFLIDRQRALSWTPKTSHMAGSALIVLLALVLLSRSVWSPYWMSNGSMKPTLLVGDYFTATLRAAGSLRRGDVVVFRDPVSGQDHVSRLVGLPGDRVKMQDGQLWLNGQPVPQQADGSYVEPFEKQGPPGLFPRCRNNPGIGGDCIQTRAVETLPDGMAHPVLDLGPTPADTMAEVTVPPDQLFVLGDNRDNASDSRISRPYGTGTVAFADVIGRAGRVLFSFDGPSLVAFWDWRPGRLLAAVR